MSGWACTVEGDIDFTNNQMSMVSGLTEVQQNTAQNLRTFLEEWFLDVTIGVPYFQSIFQKGTGLDVIKGYLKETVLGTRGMKSIEQLDIVVDAKRNATVTLAATSLYGPIELTVTV